jgi:hypothetical protein
VRICTRVEYPGVLEFEWNLTSTKHSSMASRCGRSWGFRIKINCRFCVLLIILLCFLFSFLDTVDDTFNPRCRWDRFIYLLLDVWIWSPSMRALLLGNVVAVVESMYEAAYAFLMPSRIWIGTAVGVWIGIGIGIWVALKSCKCRVIGRGSRGCNLLHAVVLFKLLN